MDRRTALGAFAGVLLFPKDALAEACRVDPTEGFTSTAVFGLLKSHFDFSKKNFLYRSWGNVLDRLKPMSDYEMSWVASYFPNFISKRESSSNTVYTDAVDKTRSDLINHLNKVREYTNVFNKLEVEGTNPSSATINTAVELALRDIKIPEPFRGSIIQGLRSASWSHALLGIALDQANQVESYAPEQSKAIRDRVYGSDEHPSFGALVNNRLSCDGKQPSRRFDPQNRPSNFGPKVEQYEL